VLTVIRRLDPDSIVLVFGDHGPLVSWRADGPGHFLAGPEFFILTRHPIRMAIVPGEACAREIDDLSRGGYITLAMAMRAIITSLSGGLDPVHETVTYSLPYAKTPYGRGKVWRYEDFLYDPAPPADSVAPLSTG
jgi:hypothetical protein